MVGKKGLRVDGGLYQAPALGSHIGARVSVRLDPAHAGRVYVFDEDGRFICLAEDESRLGQGREQVAARASALKSVHRPERGMDDVLAAAKAAGNVVSLPRRGVDHETPGLAAAAEAARARGTGDPPRATGAGPTTFMAALQKLHLDEQE